MTAAARFVVSDKGESLSPKYAPEIIAPAVIANETSRTVAMPINPIPRVPATVHELPMLRPNIAQTIHDVM